MLPTLTTTRFTATDLGCLLRKNLPRRQSFSLSFGKAHVFYPDPMIFKENLCCSKEPPNRNGAGPLITTGMLVRR